MRPAAMQAAEVCRKMQSSGNFFAYQALRFPLGGFHTEENIMSGQNQNQNDRDDNKQGQQGGGQGGRDQQNQQNKPGQGGQQGGGQQGGQGGQQQNR